MRQSGSRLVINGVTFRDPVDFISKKFDSDNRIVPIGRADAQRVPVDPENASGGKIAVVAGIIHGNKLCRRLTDFHMHSRTQ